MARGVTKLSSGPVVVADIYEAGGKRKKIFEFRAQPAEGVLASTPDNTAGTGITSKKPDARKAQKHDPQAPVFQSDIQATSLRYQVPEHIEDLANVDNPFWDDYDPNPEEETATFNPDLLRDDGPKSQGKTNHEYMKDWEQHNAQAYLATMIIGEGLKESVCVECDGRPTAGRCLDCVGCPRLCGTCMRVVHRRDPFHRVEAWTGDHFQATSLWVFGAAVFLGHHGKKCPRITLDREVLEEMCPKNHGITPSEPAGSDFRKCGIKPASVRVGLGRVITFVHINGIHHLPVFPCLCPNAPSHDTQLLESDFYPATPTDPSTVFTIGMLKQFHLFRVECHLAIESYFNVLERTTNYTSPTEVSDRRRELGRIWRQYNHLILLKRYGFGHSGKKPDEGQLALYCPTCPQPGVNLGEDWRTFGPRWLYRRYLVGDGNFVLVHLKSRPGEADIYLHDGSAYLMNSVKYDKHLKLSREFNQPSTCHDYRAIDHKNMTRKGHDINGVASVACGRHGCFCPGSTVNIPYGERQENMDAALCQAVKITRAEDLGVLLWIYDINCQYSVYLLERVRRSTTLELPALLKIIHGIGLFHIHGHKTECLCRFSPTFIPGAGMTSGEILESLWSVLNGAGLISKGMTLPHRQEFVDACIADSNWKKLLNMITFLLKAYKRAVDSLAIAEEDFKMMDDVATSQQQHEWMETMKSAHNQRRKAAKNVSAMDAYAVQIQQVVPKTAVQIEMMREEQKKNEHVGHSAWVSEGIDIQAAQLKLQREIASFGRKPTDAQELEVQTKRETLLVRINAHIDKGQGLFPSVDLKAMGLDQQNLRHICVCEPPDIEPGKRKECDTDAEDSSCYCGEFALPAPPVSLADTSNSESISIPMPSSAHTRPAIWNDLAEVETRLRVAQLEEALENLRVEIGHKSYLYRSNRRLRREKSRRLKGYAAVSRTEVKIRAWVGVYYDCRWALSRLGYPQEELAKFKDITREDTKAVTAIWDENARGMRDKAPLSWIWTCTPGSSSDDYLTEIYRVNWIRARSRFDRWTEEKITCHHEMEWTWRYFLHRQKEVLKWTGPAPGYAAYAHRQASMWAGMASQAYLKFDLEKRGLRPDGTRGPAPPAPEATTPPEP